MTKKQPRIPANLQPWIDARREFRLSREHVQMARELGLNLGRPDAVRSIEEMAAAKRRRNRRRTGESLNLFWINR
jgi:hypothetical protein